MGRPRFYYKKKGKKLDGTSANANSSKAGSLSDKRATSASASVTVDTDQDTEVQEQPTKKVKWGKQVEEGDNGESDIDEVEEGEENGKIILAIFCQNFRVACAYYDPVKLKMVILEDTAEGSHFDIIKSLLEQVNPDVSLTSSKADEASMDVIRDHMDATGKVFQIRPQKEFTVVRGKDRLYSLSLLSDLPVAALDDNSSHISSDPPVTNAYDFMRSRKDQTGDPTMKKWNAMIRAGNFASLDSSYLCLSCIGALLDYLAKVRAMADLEDEGVAGLEIRAIESIALEQYMHINADALSSLQIFDTQSHACIQSDKTKEGLSLYGILNNTRTTLGRSLLRQWLIRPSLSIPVIMARQDAVECLIRPDNIAIADVMHGHLKGLKNIPRIVKTMKAGKAKLSDWHALVKFTFHAAMLRESLTELTFAGDVEIMKKLAAVLDVAAFREMGKVIHEIIDWEESQVAGRVCVRPNIDEKLDDWKHIYNGIDSVLSRVAEQVSQTVPDDYVPSLNVVYFPQLGFLICVPMRDEWKTEAGIDILDGWTFQFSSESYVYFKSQEMHDMDTHIGDLHPSIVDREIEIIQELLEKIIVYEDSVAQTCDTCAELDCLLSFAEATRLYNYVRPQISEENIIEIRQGRHPLQELVVDTFVPNDTVMKGGMGINAIPTAENIDSDDSISTASSTACSMIVLTGANACGKSIYLKQTALIQFMTQLGCFVPAESATLGITDKIFTRIQTKESVSKMQSAFMIDLNQVSLALRNSTVRSMILLDEFGKGTLSTDGAGLLCGVLKHLLNRGSNCPKVLAATHFHDLFHDKLLGTSLPINYLHMQILLPPVTDDSDDDMSDEESSKSDIQETAKFEKERFRARYGETITYLYRVAPGISRNSHAAQCAQMFGLPKDVVRRAQYVTSLLAEHNLTQLLDEAMSEKEIQELEECEAVCRRFLAWNIEEFDLETAGPDGVKKKLAEILDGPNNKQNEDEEFEQEY